MANINTLQTLVQLRRATIEQWEAVKDLFIPKEGEPCVTLDGEYKGQIKIGDGVTTWGELPYIGEVGGALTGDGTAIVINNGVITLNGIDGATAGQAFRLNADGTGLEWYNPADSEIVTEITEKLTEVTEKTEISYAATLKYEERAVLTKAEVVVYPEGSVVNYFQDEIRVAVPSDYAWASNKNDNYYYMDVRFYAPANAKYYKQTQALEIVDEIFYEFENNPNAGVDIHNCKYTLVSVPIAALKDGVWTYYGATSTPSNYIGWYNRCDWYDENKVLIGSNLYRINLSNTNCLSDILPYYIGKYVTLEDLTSGKINVKVPSATDTTVGGVLSSTETNMIAVRKDGKMEINAVSIDKLVEADGVTITVDGGGAPTA